MVYGRYLIKMTIHWLLLKGYRLNEQWSVVYGTRQSALRLRSGWRRWPESSSRICIRDWSGNPFLFQKRLQRKARPVGKCPNKTVAFKNSFWVKNGRLYINASHPSKEKIVEGKEAYVDYITLPPLRRCRIQVKAMPVIKTVFFSRLFLLYHFLNENYFYNSFEYR